MLRSRLLSIIGGGVLLPLSMGAMAQGLVENPGNGSTISGIGIVSGWYCDAETIELRFDNGPPVEAAYGTPRGDTARVCGDSDNGYALLLNYNLFGEGTHTVRAYADGEQFDSARFEVVTLGESFQRGVDATVVLEDFPSAGKGITLKWRQSIQNFAISQVHDGVTKLDGTYELTRGSLQLADQSVIDSRQPGVDVSGRMTIDGNALDQTLTLTIDGVPSTVSLSATCSFSDAAFQCTTTGGALSTGVLVTTGARLVTSVLSAGSSGVFNELDYWQKVSPDANGESVQRLGVSGDPALEAPVGGLGNAAYERLPVKRPSSSY
ncbi:hypothetical protein [Arhodomonas sp. AD133]|uniref:hypothetical protein n=1 Tax=Arhodomonas sp. AD133 TaxID=3415009 RepID=UPI003EB890F7